MADDPLMTMTIKIHPRYAGKILEALALAQLESRDGTGDKITRICRSADYAMAAEIVGHALGQHMAKAPEHGAWGRWLADHVIRYVKRLTTKEV